MKYLIGAALAALSLSATAAIKAQADMPGGAMVLLHDEAGPCVAGALLAQYIAADGTVTPGCWVTRPGHVAIVFLDGDVGAIPLGALKPPKNT